MVHGLPDDQQDQKQQPRSRRGSQTSVTMATPTTSIPGSVAVGPKSNPLYKTRLCQSFEKTGQCPYYEKCQFAHGKEEMERWHVWRLAHVANQMNPSFSSPPPSNVIAEMMTKYNTTFRTPPPNLSISSQQQSSSSGGMRNDFLSDLGSRRRSSIGSEIQQSRGMSNSVLSADVSLSDVLVGEGGRRMSLPFDLSSNDFSNEFGLNNNTNNINNDGNRARTDSSYELFGPPSRQVLPTPDTLFNVNIKF